MKKILILALAASSFGAVSAYAADSGSKQIAVGGSVASTCIFGAGAVSNAGTSASSSTASNITFTDLTDSATGTIKANNVAVQYPTSFCNFAHKVTLSTANGGLLQTTGVGVTSGTFYRRIGYSATIDWANSTGLATLATTSDTTLTSSPTSVSANVAGAASGNLDITLNIAPDSTLPVVKGDYSDTITLTIGPQ